MSRAFASLTSAPAGLTLLALIVLFLGACAQRPSVATGPGTSITEARRLLLLTGANEPIPLIIDHVPALLGTPDDVARLAEQGAADFTRVAFVPELHDVPGADERVRLIFIFDEAISVNPVPLCQGTAAAPGRGPLEPMRLQAVFCDGSRLVGEAVGVASGPERADAERLVTVVTRTLFPGDGQSSGGFLPGVSVFGGVGGGGGDWGVGLGGVGVGF